MYVPSRRIALRIGLSIGASVLLGALLYGWAVATPSIGEPLRIASTADADKQPLWSFGFVGDTQQADDRLEPLMAAFERHNVEFVLHLGDMVDEAVSNLEWDRLLAAALKHRIRLMPVVGNHDVRGDYADDGSQRFRQYFPDLPNTFYHFRHRGVNFLMLNSERSFTPATEQANFLRWHLEHHSGTSIVCLHRPTFTASDRDRASMFARRVWLHGALRGHDVAAVFSGHNHYYERTKPLDEITYIVSGGGGGAQRQPPTADSRTATLVGGTNHFGIARVFADRIQVTAYALSDSSTASLDEFVLPVVAAKHKQGGLHNRHSMELPPLADLPQYRRELLEARRDERPQMPRPW